LSLSFHELDSQSYHDRYTLLDYSGVRKAIFRYRLVVDVKKTAGTWEEEQDRGVDLGAGVLMVDVDAASCDPRCIVELAEATS